ncbi:MAG TPA: ABC transporter permease, partial [Thermoanaerobaculia bacterium]|nr:ABC transporter permease [Thermoanaerobaculia bacterium]
MDLAARLLPEFRRTLRGLFRSPGFALSVVAVFALGIGVSTTMWSAVHALLIAPLPLAEPQRLAALYQVSPEDPRRPVAPANFLDWRREARSFSALAAWNLDLRVVTGLGEPRRLDVAWASENLFDLLGARPAAGRLFHAGEGGSPAVISHHAWQQLLGGAPVDGKVLRVGGRAVELVGVAPAHLDFPPGVEVWALAPQDIPPIGLPGDFDLTTLRDARYLGVVGRLAPGATMASADAELQAIARRLELAYPDANAHNGARVLPLAADLGSESRLPLLLLLGAALFVLLVGCLNVAGLMLARTIRRQRTLAVQAAIGGGTAALALPVLLESLLLGAVGGVCGVLLAAWAGPRVLAALPQVVLGGRELHVSAAVVGFAVVASLFTAVGAALLPVLATTRYAPAALLSGRRATSSPRRARARSALVVAQVALAFVLVAGSSLLLRTLALVAARSPGFTVERVETSRLALPPDPTLPPAARRALLTRAVEAAAATPGVRAAGAVLKLPLTGSGMSSDARVEGRTFADGEAPDVCWRAVTPGYFATIGLPVLRGRAFDARDGAGSAPAAIVNRTLASLLWPGRDPLGRRLATGLDG